MANTDVKVFVLPFSNFENRCNWVSKKSKYFSTLFWGILRVLRLPYLKTIHCVNTFLHLILEYLWVDESFACHYVIDVDITFRKA